jgi:pyrroloquinoline quinone (PQQ) biosynthesis protein C
LLREMRGFCPFCGRRHGFVTDFKHGDWIADRDLPQVQGMVIDRYYHADKIPIYRIWHAESGEETMILDSTAVLVRTLEDAFKAIADALPEIMDTIHQGLDEMIRGLEQQTESEDVGIGTD